MTTDKEFLVLVTGLFSAGKTTFLNALIGKELIPVHWLHREQDPPLYVHWNKSKWAEDSQSTPSDDPILSISLKDGRQFLSSDSALLTFCRETGLQPQSSPTEIMEDIFNGDYEPLLERISRLDIYLPERPGFENLCFVEKRSEGRWLTCMDSLLRDADAVIYMNDIQKGINKVDEWFLRDVCEIYHLEDISLVFTFTDTVVMDNPKYRITRFQEDIRKKVKNTIYQGEPHLYFLSPHEALASKLANEHDLREAEFDEAVRDILSRLRIKTLQHSLDVAFSALPNIIDKLNAEEKGVFIEKLAKLKARYSDPEFKLAVIGNFSSGKSTFLNALIGQELLATSTLPTTAIPTYIRWNRTAAMAEEGVGDGLLDGDEPLVVIKTNGGKHYCLTSSGREALARDTGITLPDDIGSMIDTLTTSASMSSLIERLDISFPERELMRNFCLIDTPGINPGDEDCRDHIVQTQSVLREEADAAIVLYTAKDAMTRDTKSFLEENGAHLMADASIVLTKMDLAPEGEAEKLVRYTTRVLREQFSQTDPTVYCISAGRASAYLSGRSLTEQDRRWAEDFQSVINHLIDRLHSRRVEIVSRRTGEMMSELIDSVSASASAEKELMEKEKSRLENASIERLEAEFNIHKNAFLKEVSAGNDQRKQKASSIVRDAMQHTQVLLTAKIEAATSMGDLNSCLQNDYPQEMKNALQRISGRMEKEIEVPLWQSASRYQKEEERCLRKYNQYLGALSRNEGSDQQKETSGANLASVDAIGGFGDNFGLFASIGIALLIPGINVFLIVAGLFVDVYRLSAKKNEAKTKLEKAINENEVTLISECWKNILEMESSYESWAEKLLADYKTRYKQDFERAEQKFQNRILVVHARIERDQEIIKSTGELKTRLENSLFFAPSDT